MKRLISLLFHDLYESSPSESGFSGAAADRYKMSARDFDAHLRAIAEARDDAPVLVGRDEAPAQPRDIPFAITVDDGGLSYYSLLAPRLEERGWRGHCMVTTGELGQRGFMDAGQVRELHERGHVIGSHSVTHPPRFHTCPWPVLVEEWRKSRLTLEDILGEAVTVGAVPGGYYAPRVAAAAHAAGLTTLFTSEPQSRLSRKGGCRLVGRYTLREGSPAALSGRLVRAEPALLAKEWMVWNGKKVLRTAMGPAYTRLGAWVNARAKQPGPEAENEKSY